MKYIAKCHFCSSKLKEDRYMHLDELFYHGKFVCSKCCKKDLYIDGAYVKDLLMVRNAIRSQSSYFFFSIPYETNLPIKFFSLFHDYQNEKDSITGKPCWLVKFVLRNYRELYDSHVRLWWKRNIS